MTMTLTLSPDDRVVWARLAAKRARERKSIWRAYAAMVTRNPKIRIEFTAEKPRTDGSTIWLRIPIELGNPASHTRKYCGERDEHLQQKCILCGAIEDVDITIRHEIAHIAFNSFAEMTDEEQTSALKDALRLEANGKPEGARMMKIQKAMETRRPYNFVMAAKTISEWFGILLNAAEDGRVNHAMIEARPGTKVMFEAQTYKIFEQGILGGDGEYHKWETQPVNMQAIIAIYCKVFGLDYRTWFADEVVKALDDFQLDTYCKRMATARSVGSIYRTCIPTLERLRELGFCRVPDEPEDEPPPPEPEAEPEEQPKGESEDNDEGEGAQEESDEGESDDSGDESGEESGDQGDQGEQDEETAPQDAPGQDEPSEDDQSSQEGGSTPENVDKDTNPTEDDGTGSQESETDTDSDDSVESDEEESGSGAGDDEESEDADEESANEGDEVDGSDAADGEDEEEEWDGSNPEFRPADEPYTEEDYERDGKPSDVDEGFRQFGRHDEDGEVATGDDPDDAEEIERALVQEEFFDSPSRRVYGVQLHKWDDEDRGEAWEGNSYYYHRRSGRDTETLPKIPESILGPALTKLRLVFADNRRTKHLKNLEKGTRVNGAVLGRRIPVGDTRIFEKRVLPGKKDWFVVIGLDVSGSTYRPGILPMIKQSALAMAEMLNRMGINFAMLAHTGVHSASGSGVDLDLYEIKSPAEPWTDKTRERLAALKSASANLDGHTLEYYRKLAERSNATDKLILYYTDGAMPAENFAEELEILQREIRHCKKHRIGIVGVGIKNSDPEEHGLDTVRLDRIEDVPKAVTALERKLERQ